MVIVYVSNNGNVALPVTVHLTANYSQTLSYAYLLSMVIIRIQNSDLTQPTNPGTIQFRIVKVAGQFKTANPDVDWKDYNEVKMKFNL